MFNTISTVTRRLDITNGAGTTHRFGAPEFIWVPVVQSVVFCMLVVFYRPLFFLSLV